jgi:hypothetical protein
MLSAPNKPIMLSVVMLSVVAPLCGTKIYLQVSEPGDSIRGRFVEQKH